MSNIIYSHHLKWNKFVKCKDMKVYISPNQEVYLYINTIYKLEALMYGNACLLRCLDIKQGNYTCMISNVYFLCLQEVSLLHINLMTFLVNINYNIVCDITNITRKCYIESGITNIREKDYIKYISNTTQFVISQIQRKYKTDI